MKNSPLLKVLVTILLVGALLGAFRIITLLQDNARKDQVYKEDYFTVNQIKYGLLSGDNWSLQVNHIIAQQIDSFNFSPDDKKVLTAEINTVLSRLFDEADKIMHKKQKTTKDKIRFKVLNALVSVNDFRPDIPKFSNDIVDEIESAKSKEEIKKLLKEKVSGFLNTTNQDTAAEQAHILAKYQSNSIAGFNQLIAQKTTLLKEHQQTLAYMLIGILFFVLLVWLLVVWMHTFYSVAFILSVCISFMALFIGVSLPMLEIDARVGTLDLKMLTSHIVFKDQVIFFRTKSILDVIHILISDGKAEMTFVGCLILLFSVLFPSAKLVCASIYLFKKNKENRFLKYMAFKSGKWSMADVMVVAIFMSYVGMQGILNDQLASLDSYNNPTLNIITTNKSNLQPGFIIFVSFVLFNLALAEILERITRKAKT